MSNQSRQESPHLPSSPPPASQRHNIHHHPTTLLPTLPAGENSATRKFSLEWPPLVAPGEKP